MRGCCWSLGRDGATSHTTCSSAADDTLSHGGGGGGGRSGGGGGGGGRESSLVPLFSEMDEMRRKRAEARIECDARRSVELRSSSEALRVLLRSGAGG